MKSKDLSCFIMECEDEHINSDQPRRFTAIEEQLARRIEKQDFIIRGYKERLAKLTEKLSDTESRAIDAECELMALQAQGGIND